MPEAELKKKLRQEAKNLRKTLDSKLISKAVIHQLVQMPVFLNSQHCLLFYPTFQELDLRPLISQYPEKHFYLPRINSKDTLDFHLYKTGDALEKNQYKISEPLISSPRFEGYKERTLMIAPALMADCRGYRLGYGKSYYDRYLTELRKSESAEVVTAVVIPETLLKEKLPVNSWDISLEWIITDQRVLEID